jgi:hypothetical protein
VRTCPKAKFFIFSFVWIFDANNNRRLLSRSWKFSLNFKVEEYIKWINTSNKSKKHRNPRKNNNLIINFNKKKKKSFNSFVKPFQQTLCKILLISSALHIKNNMSSFQNDNAWKTWKEIKFHNHNKNAFFGFFQESCLQIYFFFLVCYS